MMFEIIHTVFLMKWRRLNWTLKQIMRKQRFLGLKEYPLTVGENTIIMNVTAENGEVVTFKYSVTRDPINSAQLKHLKVQNYPFENGFDPARTHYMLTVDNEMTSLQMDFEKIDPKAKVVVRGNENFIEGRNVVEIEVTSSAKDKVETYVLEVYRQIYANNFLEYLSVDAELITPQFYKGIMEYRVEVPYDQETITFDGEATLSTSTVSGLEKFGLMYGENRFVITVSSRTKIERKYHVVVNRAHSNDNHLQTCRFN
ncbi:cadherin-like beta sandwich domain-containing protein [Erysipelothrix sp. D19-032]